MLLHVAVAESRTVLLPLWQEDADWGPVTERKGQQWPLARAGFASQLRTGPVKALLLLRLWGQHREKEWRRFRGSEEWAGLWETKPVWGKIPRNKGQKNMAKGSTVGSVGGLMSKRGNDYLQDSSSMSAMEKVDKRMYITVMMVCQSSKNLLLWDTLPI